MPSTTTQDTDPPRAPAKTRRHALQALLVPLAIYGVARLVSALILVSSASGQLATNSLVRSLSPQSGYFVHNPTPANPSYLEILTNWDGQWYSFIAEDGYIPASHGVTPESAYAWAFPPGYPYLIRGVMTLTGWSFAFTATLVSTLLGAVAMVVFYQYLSRRGGQRLAVAGVLTTSFFVSSPLLQAAYSESLALLLLVLILDQADRGHWWTATALVPLFSVVRLVSPPLAIVGMIAVFSMWRAGKRRGLFAPLIFSATALIGPFLWSTAAHFLAGPTKLFGAERATSHLRSFGLGWFGYFYSEVPLFVILLVLLVLLIIRVNTSSGTAAWGLPLRTWGWAYPLYIMAVTPPTTGFIRYLLLALTLGLPLAGSAAEGRRPFIVRMAVTAAVLVVLQVLWVRLAFVVTETSLMP